MSDENRGLINFSNYELISELHNRGVILSSESNTKVLNEVSKNNNIPFNAILTFGYPSRKMECRQCLELLDSENFSFYLSRVDKDGYLFRSNALCSECSKETNKKRKNVLDNSEIPKKPHKGDVCPSCKRSWVGNWHRHHEGDKFIEWLCGHCNMSLSDQRGIQVEK